MNNQTKISKQKQLDILQALKELKDLKVISIENKNKLLNYLKNQEISKYNGLVEALGLGTSPSIEKLIKKLYI